MNASEHADNPTRRNFLLLGLGVLITGCGPQKATAPVPAPVWRPRPSTPPVVQREYIPPPQAPTPTPTPSPGGILPRSQWAAGRPVPTRMNRMTAIRYITIHHDGMSPFYETDERSTTDRLERIRRYHRDRLNWGDIGYHYIIDRGGRVWEGRPIMYQGAHVANNNEGNIGVLLLGNFDQQSPSDRQLEAMHAHVSQLMRSHRVPVSRVTTHLEWDGARTACPGATLQRHMVDARRRGWLG